MTSRTTMMVGALALALAGAGCESSTTTGTDAGMTGTDSGMMGTDSGMMMMGTDSGTGTDSGMMMGTDSGTPDSGMMMGGDEWAAAYAQFQMRCGPCHVAGGSGGHNIGSADEARAFMDSQLQADRMGSPGPAACMGQTVGECSATRVRAGTMPPTPLSGAARDAFLEAVDAWVAAGQPEP